MNAAPEFAGGPIQAILRGEPSETLEDDRRRRVPMSEPDLRSRVRRGLLKVEQLHALSRDVFYGRRGKSNARELRT